MNIQSKSIKGWCIEVDVTDGHGCCGVIVVQNFRYKQVGGASLSDDEANYLYYDMYARIRNYTKKVLVCTDAAAVAGWSGGTGTSRRTDQLSLEGFCEYTGFEKAHKGINPNNGHTLVTYCDTWFLDSGREAARDMPVKPKVSIPKPKKTNVDAMAQQIIDALNA